MLRFNDGVDMDLSGPYRTLHLTDGWYVVGKGCCFPVPNKEEAEKLRDHMKSDQRSEDNNA